MMDSFCYKSINYPITIDKLNDTKKNNKIFNVVN